MESPDLDPYQVPPLLFETLLSKVEAWGKEFIDAAVADPGFVIDDELRARFSRYMGFQYVRGRSSRWFPEAAANDFIKIKYEDVTDDGIRNMLAENGEVTDRQIGRFREFLDGCGQWKDQDHAARAAMVAMLGSKPKASDSACSFAAGTSTKFRRSWSPARNPWLP